MAMIANICGGWTNVTQMLLPIIASRLSQLACIVLEAVNSSILTHLMKEVISLRVPRYQLNGSILFALWNALACLVLCNVVQRTFRPKTELAPWRQQRAIIVKIVTSYKPINSNWFRLRYRFTCVRSADGVGRIRAVLCLGGRRCSIIISVCPP